MNRKLIKYFFLFSYTTIIVHFLLKKIIINELFSKFILNNFVNYTKKNFKSTITK